MPDVPKLPDWIQPQVKAQLVLQLGRVMANVAQAQSVAPAVQDMSLAEQGHDELVQTMRTLKDQVRQTRDMWAESEAAVEGILNLLDV